MHLENKVQKSKLMRSLEAARPHLFKTSPYHILSHPALIDQYKLIENSPLFPFAIRLHGEMQGFIFFTSHEKKIPFSPQGLRDLLTKFYDHFMNQLEDQMKILVSLSHLTTPKQEKIPQLLKAFYQDKNSLFTTQELHIKNSHHEIFKLSALMITSKNPKRYLDI